MRFTRNGSARPGWTLLGLVLLTFCLAGAPIRAAEPLPEQLSTVTVNEQLGQMVDTQLQLRDHTGRQVPLSDYLDGEQPVLLTLNYYRCTTLCNLLLNAVTESLQGLEWTAGDGNFRIVTVSIDPRETSELAAGKRETQLAALGRGQQVDWSFLTADQATIDALSQQTGFGYAYDAETDQYAHPAVVMFLSPTGMISRYLYGLSYNPRDLRFALIDAAEGEVGSTIDRIVLSCFHYDSQSGRYTPFAFGIMRLAGVLTMLVVGSGLGVYWRLERLRTRALEPRKWDQAGSTMEARA